MGISLFASNRKHPRNIFLARDTSLNIVELPDAQKDFPGASST
jgi:hypothetical protein